MGVRNLVMKSLNSMTLHETLLYATATNVPKEDPENYSERIVSSAI